MADVLLEVKDLAVHFPTPDGVVKAVDGLSFTVHRGETFGIVGESGSGKSVTNLAVLGLLNRKRSLISGEVLFKGKDLLAAGSDELRKVRGKEIAMIFQDPFACLHPMYRVGDQIVEAIRVHESVPKRQAEDRAVEMLAAVGIPNPRQRFTDYPHQYSGGMRQRAMIAMALVNNPDLLIADEPTTALDVTVQAQILELIDRVKTEFNIGVILITHDLGVIAEVAQTRDGHVRGARDGGERDGELFTRPLHPYTWGLMESHPARGAEGVAARADRGRAAVADQRTAGLSVPSRAARIASHRATRSARSSATGAVAIRRPATSAIDEKRRLWAERGGRSPRGGRMSQVARRPSAVVSAPRAGRAARRGRAPDEAVPDHARASCMRKIGEVHAVEDVSFTIYRGETLGLVGESGCGKSTTARLVLRSCSSRPPARSVSRDATSRARAVARCGRCGARCRWCSRIRTRR